MKRINQLLLCCAVFQLAGCATIFIPSKQKVTINTQSPKSTVYVDNVEAGNGESVVTKVKKNGAKQVVVQTPGYKDEHYVLVQDKRHGAFWPLLVLDVPAAPLLYPILSDLAPWPKFFKFSKVNELPSTHKYANRTNKEKFVELEAIKLNVENKNKDLKDYYGVAYSSSNVMERIEKAEQNQLKYEQKQEAKNQRKSKNKKQLLEEDNKIDYDDTRFSEAVYKTMKKTGYIDTVNRIFPDQNNTVVLEGVVKKASVFHINGSANSLYYKAKVNITWNIKNSFGEKLDSVTEWSFSGDFVRDPKDLHLKMFTDAVENSYLNLFKNKRFTKQMQIDSNYSIKESVLSLKSPANIVKEVSDASTATVTIKRKDGGHGSGFAITNDGYILTNFHVIAGKTLNKQAEITVVLSDGTELPVTVVRFNRMRDIALLKVNKTFDKAFSLNNAKSFKNLMDVYTVGTPKSLELGQSVSKGLLSNERKSGSTTLLQLSMSVNPGNSGGPLFENNGTLHGVVTSKLAGYATEGVGFAIPSYLVPAYLNLSVE